MPTATEADRIIIKADPTASLGSVVLRGASNVCTNVPMATPFNSSNPNLSLLVP